MQQKEKAAAAAKNNAKNGARGFKSRSFKSFQESLERGENAKNFAMFDTKKKLARGEIKMEDIPYMQRANGAWDNSDVKGAKRRRRTAEDDDFERNGEKRIFSGFFANQNNKSNQAKTERDMWKAAGASFGEEKKGLFGRKAKVANINDFKAATPEKKPWWQK